MIVVDKLLTSGIGWVLRRVADAVHHELYDESSLREELLAAEMRLELGEIDEDEFRELERDLLARMRAARASEHGGAGMASAVPASGVRYAVEAIEADAGHEETGKPMATPRAGETRGRRKRR